MIVVQAEGCAPIAQAYAAGERHAPRFPNAHTIAPGIRVPAAIADYLILDAVRESGGVAVTVTDRELLDGMRTLARLEGLFASPESGAAVAAARTLRDTGFLRAEDRTVIFSTGSGLMHIDLIPLNPPVVDPDAPDLVAAIREARRGHRAAHS